MDHVGWINRATEASSSSGTNIHKEEGSVGTAALLVDVSAKLV
jgi:uncharacterized protein (DUF1501 family)